MDSSVDSTIESVPSYTRKPGSGGTPAYVESATVVTHRFRDSKDET
jgi:hypothetical protein